MHVKNIVAFIILLICFQTSMAQRRSCDMEAFCNSPSGKVPNGSQLTLSFGFINRGPDVMYSEDTTLYWLYMIVNGEEKRIYNGSMVGNPGRIINVGEKSTYGDNYGIKFSFPDVTDTLIVDFCVVVGSAGIDQNGDTLRPFSYDDPNWDNNKSCNKVMVLPQRPTAVSNIPEEPADLLIYPNPATNVLYINTEFTSLKTQQAGKAIIRDITGRIVLERSFDPSSLNNGILNINIEQIPSGVYNVTLQSGQNTMTKKLVITH